MAVSTVPLVEQLAERARVEQSCRPTIFDLMQAADQQAVSELIAHGSIQRVVDDYEEQLREFFQVQHPELVYTPTFESDFQKHRAQLAAVVPEALSGKWVFYPWLFSLVHLLDEEPFYHVRTARNRLLITEEEQRKFYDGVVGIAGLSVGSSVALAIVLQGGARHIKLADFDRLALSNTNRIRTGVDQLGQLKVEITARQIYALNPYATIDLFPMGLTPESADTFFDGLDVVVDEIDNLAVKYLIREHAKLRKLPVVMGADCGDNAVVDIERYDIHPDLPFFHGRIGEVTYEGLRSLDKFGIGRTIARHIGPENLTDRIFVSLQEMGKTIVSWPQLGGAALVNGSAVAFCVRKILNREPIEDNRATVSLDEKLIPEYNGAEQVQGRQMTVENFKTMLGLTN